MVYDLLPMTLMQRYFLRLGGVAAALALDPSSATGAPGVVTLTSELEVLHALLEQPASNPVSSSRGTQDAASTRSAFFATWSLSETPKDLRDQVLAVMKDHVTDYFFAWPATGCALRPWDEEAAKMCSDRWISGGNFAWFRHIIRDGKLGAGNRSGCVWKPGAPYKPTTADTFLLVSSAVARVQCDPATGCNDHTRVVCW